MPFQANKGKTAAGRPFGDPADGINSLSGFPCLKFIKISFTV
jgi:hypothetical protein